MTMGPMARRNTPPGSRAPSSALCVVNPSAGGGTTGRRWPVIEALLRSHFSALEIVFSQAGGEVSALTQRGLAAGHDLIIAVGGDGTAHEALNGFVDDRGENPHPHVQLGVLACGTGGDFQRGFGRMRLDQQIEAFNAATARPIDFGIAEFIDHAGHPRTEAFLNMASAGVSASIARAVNEEPNAKAKSGATTYLRSTLRALARHSSRPLEISYDGGAPRRVAADLIALANGRYFGSGMKICPPARVDDGRLDALEVAVGGRLKLIWAFRRVFSGSHLRIAGVRHTQLARAEIRPLQADGPPVWIELDGEQPGRLPASFRLAQSKILLRIAELPDSGRSSS